MRVLMLSDTYFPRVNGVSTSIGLFRQALEAQGHSVTLVCPAYGGEPDDEPGIHRVPARRVVMSPEDRLMRGADLDRTLDRLTAGQAFDVVHVQTPFIAHYRGVRVARRLGIPVVESYHTFFEEYLKNYMRWMPPGWLRAAARGFSRRQCNAVDGLVVPSRAMLDVLRGYGIGTTARIIPTGLERGQFESGDGPAFRQRHGIPAERPTLVFVGRLAFEKNVGFLLNVLARVRETFPDVLLLIAGKGPAEPALRRDVEALGLVDNVRFVGYLDRDGGLQSCYRAGDLFVFASRTETQGLVLLEALASGLPVVSTGVMGTREVVGDAEGAVLAPDAVAGFAETVVAVLGDPVRMERLRAGARGDAERWSAGAMAERLAGFYGEVVEGGAESD